MQLEGVLWVDVVIYRELARTVWQFLKLFLQVASTRCFCKVLVQAVLPDSSIEPSNTINLSVVLLKLVDAIPLLRSVEDRAAVHWCVEVIDVEEGAARVEFFFVVEGEDAREFELIVPADRVSKLRQAL